MGNTVQSSGATPEVTELTNVMCTIDWSLVADMLTGIGTLLAGLAAIFILPRELGFRREAKELKSDLKLMLIIYRKYMASEEGIVWADFPANASEIVNGISRNTGIESTHILNLLNELKAEGKL